MASLSAAGLSQRAALGLLGISRGSWHARHSPRPRVAAPVPHDQRRAASWLTPPEIEAIVAQLTCAFAAGQSVYQAFYQALDAGRPIASLSSWYRIARTRLEPQRPVRRRTHRRASAMPQWHATAPMQVWSWDITKLKGPYTGVWYDFYVVLDVFSRKIVGARVEATESAALAVELFETAIADHDGQIPQIVHSDSGPAMIAKSLQRLFRDLGLTVSRNRPRVSNDNPYSESWFKTAKYSTNTPKHFTDLDHARTWATHFVTWYNTEHRHSTLEGHTPLSVHDHTWHHIHHARQATLDALYHAHPERYTQPINLKTPYTHVTLNTPRPHDRLKTG